jgi:hypothetical protein
MIEFISGLMTGGLFGIGLMCLLQINRDNKAQRRINKILDYVNSDEFEQLFESYANFNEANCNINHFAKKKDILGGDVDDE